MKPRAQPIQPHEPHRTERTWGKEKRPPQPSGVSILRSNAPPSGQARKRREAMTGTIFAAAGGSLAALGRARRRAVALVAGLWLLAPLPASATNHLRTLAGVARGTSPRRKGAGKMKLWKDLLPACLLLALVTLFAAPVG